ncbi:MAG: PAS domain-containing protein [Alphaproteobacteria bacterium]|nr:PAS domain-containing protein [Alphaproteobacteria bacterium]
MRVQRFCRIIFGACLMLGCGVSPALAQTNPTSLVPGPLVAIFAIAFIAAAATALFYSSKVRRLTAQNAALDSELGMRDAMSLLRQEQAILWPFDKDIEIVSAGFASSLDIEGSDDNQFSVFLDQLKPEDAEALQAAVHTLRHDRQPFLLTVATADMTRTFLVRGDSVVADASGAAIMLVSDRTIEAARVERLSTDAAQMHELLDALPIPVWLRDDQQRLQYVNQAYREAVEVGESLVTDQLPEISAGTGSQSAKALAERTVLENAPQSDRQHVVMGGARHYVELIEIPMAPTGGTAGFALDLTQLEEVQAELSRHVAGQEVILQNLGTAIAIYDADQSLQFFNNAFLQLWGLDEALLRGTPRMGEVLEQLRENRRLPEYADFPAFKNEQLRLFTTLIEPVEEMVHLPDGTTLRSVAIPHPFGGLLLLWEDVTDTLALERNYNTLIAVQRETLDNLFEGVAVIGANGRLRLSNPAFGSMWQIPPHELANEPHISEIANHISDLIGEMDELHTGQQQLIGILTDRDSHSGRMERVDGSVLDYATVPLPDGAVLLSFLDVSAAINMERALRERNEALETADQLKSEFIANVSYELRTPLNTIIGFTEILGGEYFGDLNDRQTEYTGGILESSNRLLLLINDILDLATIEAGHMSLELDSIDINAFLNSALGLVHERARQKKLTIECDCPPDIGAMVADERRLKQAIFNILSNAVKFTPDNGNIVVSARRQGDEIVLTTSDSGIGITPADRDRVFAKFERGSSTEARRSGAGLGLSLVKSFVEMHGGKVALESGPEDGTRVICTLPSRAAPLMLPPDVPV